MTGNILIVDDYEDTAMLMRDAFRVRGFAAEAVSSAHECLEHLRSEPVDVVVTDIQMPVMSGIELCEQLRDNHPDLLPIVLTGEGALSTAVAALRAGAYDNVTKSTNLDALALTVTRALEHVELKREVKRLRSTATREAAVEGIVGTSPAIRATLDLVRRVADSDASVLITGESGTGKELVAKALHHLSPRREQPFIAVNCAAMPASLLESELFGHVRGAFTDARTNRSGLFVQAGGGTIFLDEVSEMALDVQVKILRALQEHRLRPVGADVEVPFHARVISASNRNLELEVAEKRFREDLFYRLNVVGIPVPPLRERAGDVLMLAQRFIERIARRINKPVRGLTAAAARSLVAYDWPGNVRELENCIERAVALCRLDEVTCDDLPAKVRDHRASCFVVTSESPCDMLTLVDLERRYVRQVLLAVGGNKTHAARVLGIDRRSLYRRLQVVRALPLTGQGIT
jgi:DNA-binding NtrC family response regulator